MKATVNVLCYKSKTLRNGEHPLMICVCKEGKRKYISLGISVKPNNWDFEKNKPKRNCPNREQIIKLLNEQEQKYSEQILEFSMEQREYSPATLVEAVAPARKVKTVGDLFNEYIAQLKGEGRLGYALSVQKVCNSLCKFRGHLDIYFSELDESWLRKYESYLKSKHLANNTIGIRMRNIRTIYNLAIKEGHVKAEHYPFKDYKTSKLNETTPKRAITRDNVVKIIKQEAVEINSIYKELAIDLFTFSYLMGGINFTDMARLTNENIMDEQLVYRRKKTKKLIHLPLHPKAMEIINKYKSSNLYLFPILSSFHKTEQQKMNRIHKVIGKVNACLKTLGNELELNKKLTTYVARHSYATTLKRAGVNTSVISEALGHSSERVTQIYLDSFENTQMKAAMKNLL